MVGLKVVNFPGGFPNDLFICGKAAIEPTKEKSDITAHVT